MIQVPQLTSIRGLMALWVFDVHLNSILMSRLPYLPIISGGYLGVPVFFMLSISLLLKSLDENQDLKHYFIRRVKRIWPMYIFTVLLVFAYYHPSNWTWLASQLTFTGIFGSTSLIGYVFWSLQVEEIAYLFFPFIHETRNKRIVAYILIVSGIISFIIIVRVGETAIDGWWWVPIALPSYGFGILAYLKKIPKLAFFTLPFVLLYFDNQYLVMGSIFVMPGFAYIIQRAENYNWLKNRILVFIGKISYGIYLIHFFLIDILGWFSIILVIPVAWLLERTFAKIVRR